MFEKFRMAGEKLFLSGCNDSHSGNISVKEGTGILITGRSAMLSCLKENDIVRVELEEGGQNDARASRDLAVHRFIYKTKGALSVIHAHPPNIMALCITENKILPQDVKGQALFHQGISILKGKQGADSDEISRQIMSALSEATNIIVAKGYGIFAFGSSLEEALEIATAVELSSKIWLLSKLVPQKQAQSYSNSQGQNRYDQRKRSAIPPGIGVMDRRTGGYGRRDIKR